MKKIEELLVRLHEVEEKLADPSIFADKKAYKELSQEHAFLTDVKSLSEKIQEESRRLEENRLLLRSESDPELIALLQEENVAIENSQAKLQEKLKAQLLPPHPDDNRNVIVELRAGTGGEEAALFVADCVRMYLLYAGKMGWHSELLSCTPSEKGGLREYVMAMRGAGVKRFMQFEAGTHRVQRVPETEAQGRIHTSAITIAVLLEPDEDEEIIIDEKDLKIDTFRSSGAGGQHVNVTDSAVRITHLPTGIVTHCQQERSQHKNKDKALRLLQIKLAEKQREEKAQKEASTRAGQVGSGDRSERIRTYNFPQNRVTDHRINFTLYSLDKVMDGELESLSQALVAHFYENNS